ncbi:endosulphine family protein [Nannizzia gypsea CBS 118893]|uniref:mRNA stability protein n=1 Tax=Arthroderma gypseum (strain ATCC MYA-4604 / CBS 118893) TaxID=535722 RepID=E5QZG7_ARTGP|nr:endosulphine family protein [Nannizzia gypsea CBS 118893]EFQ98972.1 endosulphine family protein [Nannizzia gypsea CBS 118893]
MNPHQQNKIDVNSLSPDEQRLLRMYGKMPNKKDLLQNKLKERKYFDSGDYAMSKAGKASDVTTIGSRHPLPENIPHLTASSPPQSAATPSHFNGGHGPAHSHPGGVNNGMSPSMARSPIKEGSFLQRQTSMEDAGNEEGSNDGTGPKLGSPETRETQRSKLSMSESRTEETDDSSSEIPIRR